jgi:hypothetical protein
MKPTRYKKWAVLVLALANGFLADAQSNGVPGPTDYGRFSSFVTERNIFDPGRFAHSSPIRSNYRPRISRSAPTFTLVGTMSYGKGMFAFFDGNQPELRKVLYQSESNSIAGYTVVEITSAGVKLQAADKKQTVQLKIGDMMRQEGSAWQLAGQGGSFASTSAVESPVPAADNASPDAGATPSPALEGNDVLKKLMQQREQQLK